MNVRKRSGILIVFAGLLTAGSLVAAIPEPIPVEGGLISGTPGWGWNVREFRGIPFAAPPTGNLRWRPPQPVIPWQGVRAADRFSPVCLQQQRPINQRDWNEGLIRTSEDCLYLNVWTPAGSASDRLPVMVYIYGGGGVQGGTSEPRYDGNAMAKKGVVVVSMNYRVNAFGWLAHPELTQESPHHSSGNYGSLDQLAALQWVKKYISQFGGDPERVTIWGQSAGSHSVNSLVASPLASGLFRAAIGQSGLMQAYEKTFATCGRKIAQVLLTREDLSNRTRFLNARNTIQTLLNYGVIPVINENDTVSVDEIKFGDNDNLSGGLARPARGGNPCGRS